MEYGDGNGGQEGKDSVNHLPRSARYTYLEELGRECS